MNKNRGFVRVLLLIGLFVAAIVLYSIYQAKINRAPDNNKTFNLDSPSPTPYQFPYKNPQISKDRAYRTVIVGDSIVASLGVNANLLRLYLIDHFPNNEFVNYNYGYPATNILSLPERLTQKTKSGAEENPPILKQGFELIILESFAYNPLSQFPLSEGLQKQSASLEKSVGLIFQQKPHVALAFLTPIAPDPNNFAKGAYDLNPKQRSSWIKERIAYIENHKQFAIKKGIPVIDVYTKSLKANGEVDKIYISDDFIHPSQKGIELISHSIADYIFDNKIFPE